MKQTSNVLSWLDDNEAAFTSISDQIWQLAEPAWEERESAEIQIRYLESIGFTIEQNIVSIPTASEAEWGEGKPVLGFVGEYDALPGLSQKAVPVPDPAIVGGPGHGCGHNLLGTGCMASAAALPELFAATAAQRKNRYPNIWDDPEKLPPRVRHKRHRPARGYDQLIPLHLYRNLLSVQEIHI